MKVFVANLVLLGAAVVAVVPARVAVETDALVIVVVNAMVHVVAPVDMGVLVVVLVALCSLFMSPLEKVPFFEAAFRSAYVLPRNNIRTGLYVCNGSSILIATTLRSLQNER